MSILHRLLPKTLSSTLLFVVAAIGAAAAIVVAVQQASEQLLRQDAEGTALTWAHFAESSVEGLQRLLIDGQLGESTRRDLVRFRKVQDVFRFKLFDREGRPILVSDDLEDPAVVGKTQSGAGPAGIGHGNERVKRVVLGGANHIELHANGHNPARPARYSEAYVPLKRDGQVIGVVEVYVDQTERQARVRAAFGTVAAVVFALLAAFAVWGWRRLHSDRIVRERMRYLARHDALSGLLNRTSFGEALREAAWRRSAGGPAFAVLCLDLDHFKDINDAHGHRAGDEVLRQVGARLQTVVQPGDRLCRLGGDEFAILQSGIGSVEAVSQLASRLIAALGAPYEVNNRTLHCGASIGIAISDNEAKNVDELMHQADLALYRAKSSGRGAFGFYDAELDSQREERNRLACDLRQAIGTDQVTLHYQPLFKADGRQLIGYEALVRWTHPTRGPLPPAQFIPLAEEIGLIDALGAWVLQEACNAATRWPSHLSVAVNLSAAQFRHGDLVPVVARSLDASGLPAKRLQLEITESILICNTEQVVRTLESLAQMGARIAMDDFGTGYSSLAYLWRFPFDKLKIDRAFTQHLGNDDKVDVIVRSIISLAHSLRIDVNAEGVETEGQIDALCELGCDELQGFLLGRPQPEADLEHRSNPSREARGTPGRSILVTDGLRSSTEADTVG